LNNPFSLPFYGLAIVVALLQIFIPGFLLEGIIIIPDLLLIFMVYTGILYGRFYCIIVGFFFGLIQDFAMHYDIIGAMAFTKSIVGFFFGSLSLYRNIWTPIIRAFIILGIFLLHFIIFLSLQFNGVYVGAILFYQVALLNTFTGFFILLLLDKSIFRSLFTG